MKSWEFLIQKEGDRQWVPIPTPTFELEAGVYRIMANSHRINSDIEVRITHQTPTEENSPHDPQNHCRHINQQGLVMILPFTKISAGILKIRCCGDIMSELLGESWQETLELQILDVATKQSSPDGELKSSTDVTHNISTEAETQDFSQSHNKKKFETPEPTYINNYSNEKAQFYLQQLEQLMQEKVEPLINNYGTNFQQDTDYFAKLASSEEIIAPTLQLILDQDTFQGNPGESVILSGKIEVQDADEDLALTAQLCYQLKHPQTNEILLKIECPLPDEMLPYEFNETLVIPDELDGIPFLLGEVVLETITGISMTDYPFKIYSSEHHPVSYTLELFNTEQKSSYQFDFKVTEKTSSESTPIELPTAPKHTYGLTESVSSSRQVLPPKLKRLSNSSQSKKKQLDLPKVISK